jgi:hypothetical protein
LPPFVDPLGFLAKQIPFAIHSGTLFIILFFVFSLLLKIFAYFYPTLSSCPRLTERRDRQIPFNSFGSKAFKASWCGGTQSPILRSCCCCFFFFFSACICIGLLCFKKFTPIQKTILLQFQKDMCEFGLMFVSLLVGCEGK